VLLADEPTGNLDTRPAEDHGLLRSLNRDQGITVIMVTHKPTSQPTRDASALSMAVLRRT
jgi:ABC-type lipoprotein export system ATPase subunit